MIAMRPRRVRRLLALVASGAVLAAVGVAFLFAPDARASTPAGAVILEPAYSLLSWWQFLGNLVVTLILSGAIAVCLIVAVLWMWERTTEGGSAVEAVDPMSFCLQERRIAHRDHTCILQDGHAADKHECSCGRKFLTEAAALERAA